MSGDNRLTGQHLYASGDAETRAWFEQQWAMWPRRAEPSLTTNLSLHYGGIVAFREEHGRDPIMSGQLASNVRWMDRGFSSEGDQA